jgi:hypothetical protein
MKLIKNVFNGLFILAGIIALSSLLHAQDTANPLQAATDLDAMLQAVEATTPLPADTATDYGIFYSAQHAPGSDDEWPPLPGNIRSVPVWPLGNDFYLLDDLGLDYSAPQTHSLARGGVIHEMDLPGPGDGGDGGDTNGDYTPDPIPEIVFTTNQLWLQIIGVTNTTAYLWIHQPWNVTNGVYDLLYCTNITAPIAWQWVLRTDPGQTNLVVSNAVDGVGLYALGTPNDLFANDSLGTNFWLTFMGMNTDDPEGNNFSLSISSPVGATGTVSIPGFYVNGNTVIVTNCGDANVNGTYLLTNLTAQEQSDWDGTYTLNSTAGSYVKGTNWIGYGISGIGYSYIFGYDPANPGPDNFNFLYYKSGVNLNANSYDWSLDPDADETNATPTTICPQILFNKSFSVTAGAVTNIAIDNRIMISSNDAVVTNGIHVTASAPVSVYAFNYSIHASTAFTCYPVPLLGTNYWLMARPTYYYASDSELAIVATTNNTTVYITPSTTAVFGGHTGFYSTNLQQGQTYQIHSDGGETGDVTGTRITSTAPIGVFAGASLAFVPTNTDAANPLVQEQLPVELWGSNVLSMGFAGRTNGDSYRILAAYSNSVVTVTGLVVTVDEDTGGITTTNEVVVTNLDAGEFYDTIIQGPAQFQANLPIQVAHFANGSDLSGEPGDPCEILLPPVGHYLDTNIVVTLTNDLPYQVIGDFSENYLNLIVPQSAISTTFVDGLNVAATNFVTIGTSGYYGAQLSVTNSGAHTITGSQPVGVEVYGFGIDDAYGYFGGEVK